jgi:selenocysteine-specific elongation factor
VGTSEVLARVALFEQDLIREGEEGWVQLRLEDPVLARVGDHLVFRSYSPVTTMGGGRIAEVLPRKRRALKPGEGESLRARLADSPDIALESLLNMSSWVGVPEESLPQRTGHPPADLREAIESLSAQQRVVAVDQRLFSGGVWREGEKRILAALDRYHGRNPLRTGIPLEELRQVLPGDFGPKLSEAVLKKLSEDSKIILKKGAACLADFRPSLTKKQEAVRSQLQSILGDAGLSPPSLKELGDTLGVEGEIQGILSLMEEDGEVVSVDGDFFFHRDTVFAASLAVIEAFPGAEGLGPADFREVLPITRRHLLPLLRYFDLLGVTTRIGDERKVAEELPPDWAPRMESPEP